MEVLRRDATTYCRHQSSDKRHRRALQSQPGNRLAGQFVMAKRGFYFLALSVLYTASTNMSVVHGPVVDP